MNDKLKRFTDSWLDIKKERIKYLIGKYGYLPCEYCGARIGRMGRTSHHILKRYRGGGNNKDNCYICHRRCHDYIHLKKLKVKQEDFQGCNEQ